MSQRNYYYVIIVKTGEYVSFSWTLITDVKVSCEVAELWFLHYLVERVHSDVKIVNSYLATRKEALENSLIINLTNGI